MSIKLRWCIFVLITIFVLSCSPKINYIGDQYPPTSEVDIYYDMADVQKDFRTMGMLSANNSQNTFLSLEDIKSKIIEDAKQRGADAIVFISLVSNNNDVDDQHFIEAKLLKYE